MNVSDFTQLLQKPNKVISPNQINQLEEVLEEYPYFQVARALQLKGLNYLNSFKYNNALRITAAYTADRDVLFDFITSEEFLQNSIADSISGKTTSLVETEIISEEIQIDEEIEKTFIEASSDNPLPRSIKEADQILDPALFKSKDPKVDKAIAKEKKRAKEMLALGEPLPFSKKEKYSFGQWLKLTSLKKIVREGGKKKDSSYQELEDIHFPIEDDAVKSKKFELIDKFIEHNPKLVPRENVTAVNIENSVNIDADELMTETLARVYLEQKKYKKAIQAFKILSLKYPEKSGFFADRIRAVEKLMGKSSEQ